MNPHQIKDYQMINLSLIKGDKSEFNIEMERWYPSMSINQINYRDCTNHENSDLSCIQPHQINKIIF